MELTVRELDVNNLPGWVGVFETIDEAVAAVDAKQVRMALIKATQDDVVERAYAVKHDRLQFSLTRRTREKGIFGKSALHRDAANLSLTHRDHGLHSAVFSPEDDEIIRKNTPKFDLGGYVWGHQERAVWRAMKHGFGGRKVKEMHAAPAGYAAVFEGVELLHGQPFTKIIAGFGKGRRIKVKHTNIKALAWRGQQLATVGEYVPQRPADGAPKKGRVAKELALDD